MEENNFYYIGGNNEIAFDANYLNNLISSEKFEEASDYFKQFESNNALTRAKQKAKINELDTAARKKKAIYSNLNDEEIADIKLANVILKKGGIDQLRYERDATGHLIWSSSGIDFREKNQNAAHFEDAYNMIGASINNDNLDFINKYYNEYLSGEDSDKLEKSYRKARYEESEQLLYNNPTSLKITIPKKKVGLFGIDFLVKDDNHRDEILNNFANLTNGLGLSELKNSGVSFTEEDNGDLTIIYDKTSEYAKHLTLAIAVSQTSAILGKEVPFYNRSENRIKIQGYDSEGNEMNSKTPSGYDYDMTPYYLGAFGNMVDIYNKVNNTKTKAFTKNDNLERDFSSTSFNLSQIKTDGDKKLITEHVKSMAFADYKHYGFLDSDEGKNTLLKEFDEKQFEQFITQMNGRGLNQIHYQGMVVNGTTGVLITLDPKLDSNGNPAKGSTRMKMFIPNYLNSLTNYDINSSTDLQAMMEYNNMKNYGENYQYKFEDGSKAYIDSFGNIRRINSDGYSIIDNSSESKQNLIRDIDRDFILKQADMQIGKYMNNKGQYNMKGVRTDAAIIAYAGAEELYPDIPLTTIYGKEITLEDIFDDNRTFMQTADETCNMFVLMKLQEMYNLYDKIIGKVVKKQVE